MEASRQLLWDFPRLAVLDAGCSLEMTFGVKGEWKERKDDGEDDPGQPKMAHMRRIHNFIFTRNRRVGEFFAYFVPVES